MAVLNIHLTRRKILPCQCCYILETFYFVVYCSLEGLLNHLYISFSLLFLFTLGMSLSGRCLGTGASGKTSHRLSPGQESRLLVLVSRTSSHSFPNMGGQGGYSCCWREWVCLLQVAPRRG